MMRFNISDVAVVAGCLAICGGIWMFSPRVALITAGLLLVGGAVLLHKPAKGAK